jgi:ATP-binding cassette subfamily B protein
VSHVLRHKWYTVAALAGVLALNALNSAVQRLIGVAFDALLEDAADRSYLLEITAVIAVVVVLKSAIDLGQSLAGEVVGQRLERDARDELYVSLLGKSQTFHNRQRVGDLMARANNDVRQLNQMINPGLTLMTDSMTALVMPIIFIGFLDWRLLLAPLLFTAAFAVALRVYTRQLNPVAPASGCSSAR